MSTLADILADVRPPITPAAARLAAGVRNGAVKLADQDGDPRTWLIRVRHGVCEWLKDTPVIVINEVAKYFFEDFWDEHEAVKERDFPNVAPPFWSFWMEYRVPRTITGGEPRQTVPMEFGGQRVGFYWLAVDQPDVRDGWLLTSLMFVEHEGWAPGPVFSARANVDGHGQLTEFLGQTFIPEGPDVPTDEAKLSFKTLFTLHYPALLAICFMHCSNVRVVDHQAKEGHRRKHQKLYGRPPIVYKTLSITPMQKIIASKGGPGGGLKQALHIMRGHFKSFDSKPLFGKHKGMWWWSSVVRGNLQRGYVKKAYEVRSPKEGEQGKQ